MISKATIKFIQSLQQKKYRESSGCFVAEGPKVVGEMMKGKKFILKELYADKRWLEGNEKYRNNHSYEVEDFELQKISGFKTHNAVVAVFEQIKIPELPQQMNGTCLVLDALQDPGNFGTIVRTADWFGIEHIFCSPDSVDMYNSKVVQSTMASLGRVQIHYTDLGIFLSAFPHKKYAAVLGGKVISTPNNFEKNACYIIGNESRGISPEVLRLADAQISIPSFGEAESLNAAVAAGILLFAASQS